MTTPFQNRLMLRLATGIATLPETDRAVAVSFFLDAQTENGGFRGRRGIGELYYTDFALRGLTLLDAMPNCNRSILAFLKTALTRNDLAQNDLECVERVSLLNSALILEATWGEDLFSEILTSPGIWFCDQLHQFKTSDGGFASSGESQYSSTYHNFLVLSTMQLFGWEGIDVDRIVQNILNRQRPDGGFVELPPLKVGGTNPTAAAVCLLGMLDIHDYPKDNARCFLKSMQSEEGGFLAHARIPVPDLLSTFTAIVALHELDAWDAFDTEKTLRFVRSLRHDSGGYAGACWDHEPDVEYTFYALATQAFLGSRHS